MTRQEQEKGYVGPTLKESLGILQQLKISKHYPVDSMFFKL